MSISRSGPVPEYCDYIVKKALLPHKSDLYISEIKSMGISEWLEIPKYQRGISWGLEDIIDLMISNSKLIGNIILAQFDKASEVCEKSDSDYYLVLIDGLQRFAIGTMIISILDEKVLNTTSAFYSMANRNFKALSARVLSYKSIYTHNDYELKNHPRKAISEQYKMLKSEMEEYIEKELKKDFGKQLSVIINKTFLDKQIAVDTYFNFKDPSEVMSTFIGINIGRIDLGPLDLLRANIVQRASMSGWAISDIEEFENNFTEVFTLNDKPDKLLMPFVNVILKQININGDKVFPSWSTGLSKKEIEIFIEFIDKFKNILLDNSYLREIKSCGGIPIAIVLSYYYVKKAIYSESDPSFITGGTKEFNELKVLLRSFYRVLLDGNISRLRKYAEKIIEQSYLDTLFKIADDISEDCISVKINTVVNRDWLLVSLNKVNKEKARRVFNMMLLPIITSTSSIFEPLVFGRKSVEFNVDHLIPEKLLNNKDGEGQTIRNFAPCPQNLNNVAKTTPCSSKLSTSGIYDNYVKGRTHQIHPYCEYLLNSYFKFATKSDLDNEILLQLNQSPNIGDERVNQIATILIARL